MRRYISPKRPALAVALAATALCVGAGSASADINGVLSGPTSPVTEGTGAGGEAVFRVGVTHDINQPYPGFNPRVVLGSASADDLGGLGIDPVPREESCFLGSCSAVILVTVPIIGDS